MVAPNGRDWVGEVVTDLPRLIEDIKVAYEKLYTATDGWKRRMDEEVGETGIPGTIHYYVDKVRPPLTELIKQNEEYQEQIMQSVAYLVEEGMDEVNARYMVCAGIAEIDLSGYKKLLEIMADRKSEVADAD